MRNHAAAQSKRLTVQFVHTFGGDIALATGI
jgi:hypothetical protein